MLTREMSKLDFDSNGLPGQSSGETLRGAKAIQEYLGRLSSAEKARGAGKPLMAYFYVRQPTGKKVKPTPQSKACSTVQGLFDGSDAGIGVAAKFFVLVDVDVTDVTPKDNPAFNAYSAPMIAFIDSEGALVTYLPGRVSGSMLLRAMMQTLIRSGVSPAKINTGKGILSRIKTLEDGVASAKQQIASANRRIRDAEKRKQASQVASQQRALAKAEAELKQASEELTTQKKLWEDLFKAEEKK